MAIIGEVIIENTAPPGHAEGVAAAFKRVGLDVEVEAVWIRKSADILPWVVKLCSRAHLRVSSERLEYWSRWLWEFKRLVRDVQQARRGAGNGTGSIDISESENTHLVLPNSLPDEALEALRGLDWTAKRGEYLIWRSDRSQWEDPGKRE